MNLSRSNPGKRFTGFLQAVMASIYCFCGLFLLFSAKSAIFLPDEFSPWVPLSLIIYGLFRAFRAWLQLRQSGFPASRIPTR